MLVNCRPELLSDAIAQRLLDMPEDFDWRSPLLEDHYAEYRDQTFLDRLAGSPYFQEPERPQQDLADFWPRFGPQWDASCCYRQGPGTAGRGKVTYSRDGHRSRAGQG